MNDGVIPRLILQEYLVFLGGKSARAVVGRQAFYEGTSHFRIVENLVDQRLALREGQLPADGLDVRKPRSVTDLRRYRGYAHSGHLGHSDYPYKCFDGSCTLSEATLHHEIRA